MFISNACNNDTIFLLIRFLYYRFRHIKLAHTIKIEPIVHEDNSSFVYNISSRFLFYLENNNNYDTSSNKFKIS